MNRSLERILLAGEVFDAFPYGIMVVDRTGTMVASNRALQELLDLQPGADTAPTCCELFGCREPGGPLEGACLTELALQAGGRLSEMRIELAWGSPVDAVWVTVSPLGGPSRVVYQVRPGQRRVTGSGAVAEPAPHIRIFALGRCRVESPAGPLDGDWLRQRPGQLLKLLVVERHRVVAVEEIADTLWPNRGRQALGNVRSFIHALRKRLEPARERGSSSFIIAWPGGYAIDPSRVRVDADEFEAGVEAAMAALAGGDRGAAVAGLDRALKLYGGEFLEDELYAEWALTERNRLREMATRALETVAELKRRAGDLDGAAGALERLVALEPFDDHFHQRLLALCLKRGRRTEAMRRFSALRVRMMREFGEEPGFRLADLAESDQPPARATR